MSFSYYLAPVASQRPPPEPRARPAPFEVVEPGSPRVPFVASAVVLAAAQAFVGGPSVEDWTDLLQIKLRFYHETNLSPRATAGSIVFRLREGPGASSSSAVRSTTRAALFPESITGYYYHPLIYNYVSGHLVRVSFQPPLLSAPRVPAATPPAVRLRQDTQVRPASTAGTSGHSTPPHHCHYSLGGESRDNIGGSGGTEIWLESFVV